MGIFERQDFIDRTARKPYGEKSRKGYSHPKYHYESFRIILKLLALTPQDHYLEIGCGGGVLLNMALQTVAFGAGIDHSQDMVHLSREKNAKAFALGKAQVKEGDATFLPWEDGQFSAAASANMFFFVENPQSALDEIYRVLAPGGRFAMTTSANTLLAKIVFGWFYQLKSYSNPQMTQMLEKAGFQDIQVDTHRFLTQACFARKAR